MSLTLHRVTGSVEATKLYHHAGFGISYTDVRCLTNEWAKSISLRHRKMLPQGFLKKRTVHVTFDNSDGKQQTITGDHTTHHTTGTIFQARYAGEDTDADMNDDQVQEEVVGDENNTEEPNFGNYKIPKKKRKSPKPFPGFTDKYSSSNLLDDSLYRDIAWVLVGYLGKNLLQEVEKSVPIDDIKDMGSWTAFMKDTASAETTKCKLEYFPVVPFPPSDNVVKWYFPVVPFPPSDNVVKWYMDMIIQLAEDLEIDHVFVHADEAIHSKMLMIMWLHEGKYDKLLPLIGGFHTLLVYLKILHKKYACLGLQQWWVDANAIQEGSVCQAIEGRHYYRAIKLHKQSFNALMRCKIDQHLPVEESMKNAIVNLRWKTNACNLQVLLQLDVFQEYCQGLLIGSSGTQSQMMLQYIKDVSGMLALIFSVREKSIELHAAAERRMLPKLFAFDHINYARYLTVQHVDFEKMEMQKKEAVNDLKAHGFGGSLSGEKFSTIHGDLITETTINHEVKVRGGPMRGGYSTSLSTTDAFIKTSHVTAKIRRKVKERMSVLTTSVHKELTPGARTDHDKVVSNLASKVMTYFDPFLDVPARHLKTGQEIEPSVITGLIASDTTGECLLQKFIKERLMAPEEEKISLFETITKTRLKTGMEKKKKRNKVLDIIKEDRQAFGLLVGKVSCSAEALEFPITTVPLALAEPDLTLKQQQKHPLRNHLYETADATKSKPTGLSDWFVDGMAAVRFVSCKDTWKEYAEALLNYCMPKDSSDVRCLTIVFDSYERNSIKQMTQIGRGYSSVRVHITSLEQNMPKRDSWNDFLSNPENKTELIRALVGHYKSSSTRSILPYPVIVTEETRTWGMTRNDVIELLPSNHIEAHTRLILEASKSDFPVVIKATDTDVLVLMCYAHTEKDFEHDWLMQIVIDTYVSVKSIRSHFGDELCSVLPAYHSITGCDTTSYPANIGKIRPLSKMLKNKEVMHLLRDLGSNETSFNNVSSAIKFYHTVMYSGKHNETITDTRVRMYEKQKVKSSMNLISDKSSVRHHVLRADLQAFVWKQCMMQDMIIPALDGRRGWCERDGQVLPVWYDISQLPPSLIRSPKKKATKYAKQSRAIEPPTKETKIHDVEEEEKEEDEQFGDISLDSSGDNESISSSEYEIWEDSDWDSEDNDEDDPDW